MLTLLIETRPAAKPIYMRLGIDLVLKFYPPRRTFPHSSLIEVHLAFLFRIVWRACPFEQVFRRDSAFPLLDGLHFPGELLCLFLEVGIFEGHAGVVIDYCVEFGLNHQVICSHLVVQILDF